MSAIANDGAGGGKARDAGMSAADLGRAQSLMRLLRGQRGATNAVTVQQLATDLGVSARKVRTLVTYLREGGCPILATPDTGYFWPATRQEADHTLAFLAARVASTQRIRSGIERGLTREFGPSQSTLL